MRLRPGRRLPAGQLCNTGADPNQCVDPGCGNSVLEPGEGCDDGNTTGGDGCNSVCLRELGELCSDSGQCASAFCDPDGTCACDDDGDCSNGQECKTDLDPNECVPAGCGNGVLGTGEGCDDGNLVNGDGCNSACLRELGEVCSDSGQCASDFCDPTGSICACDQDADCPAGQLCNLLGSPNTCVDPGCGNGVLEIGEGCDDGNTSNGDGCNSACLKEIGEICGLSSECASAFCDPADGTCACDDDGDCSNGQECKTDLDPNECVPAGCGNGVLGTGEGCDDGNLVNGDGCDAQCLIELTFPCILSATCASGLCDPNALICVCDMDNDCPGGQLCDTGADPNQCVDSICGNGTIEGAEECDDQNTLSNDGCSSDCLVEESFECTGEPSNCDPAPCSSDADCQFCNEQYNICVKGCTMAGDCPSGFFCDTQSAICVPFCQDGSECPSGVCDVASGECVECATSADCPEGETCNGGVCGDTCELGTDCATGLSCDPQLNICVECVTNADCQNGLSCIDSHCLPGCNEEADCSGDPCNETVGICIACVTDADCAGGQVCETAIGQCIQIGCTKDTDCPVGQVCDEPNHTCVQCVEDADCPTGQVCDEPNHVCVECVEDTDCPSGQVCDEPNHVCVGCTQDTDCEAGLVCDEPAAECVECTEDTDCEEGTVCDETVRECVECTADSECTGGTCDLETRKCDTDAIVAEGNGILCAAKPGTPTDNKLAFALLGLLGLTLLRRRRR
ncbi:MAG: DUF4215 domain-containing protein [Polyangiaceae bacterium]